MANSIAKDLEIMFESYVEGFDSSCVISQAAEKSFPEPKTMQRAGDTFYRKQNYQASVVTGLDVSAATKTDVIERLVGTSFRQPDNIVYDLNGKEMRDPTHLKKMGEASAQRLAAEIDKNLYAKAALEASIVIKKTGALSWDDAALARSTMLQRGISSPDKKLFLNSKDCLAIAKDLGNRAYLGDVSKTALERAAIPDIAGFSTFETDNVYNLAAVGNVTGTTVSGAQSFTPSAMTGDLPTDNRRMTLTIAGANIANIKNGDAFTIANVNAVHNIDKSDTGDLMTFRVISGGGTSSVVITPAIIATGPYQNVSAAAANGAAITFLNTTTKPVNVFWAQGAVTLDFGKLAFPNGQGAEVMTATTKQGVPLIMAYKFDPLTGVCTTRCTTLYATTVLNPEACGIILANQ